MTTTAIGTLIRTARAEAGISQAKVAKVFGYTSATNVSSWERGVTTPPEHTFKKLCKTLDITPTEMRKALVKTYETKITKLLN